MQNHKSATGLVPKIPVSAHIPLELAEKMRAEAERQRITYSEALRVAIAEWVVRQQGERK